MWRFIEYGVRGGYMQVLCVRGEKEDEGEDTEFVGMTWKYHLEVKFTFEFPLLLLFFVCVLI